MQGIPIEQLMNDKLTYAENVKRIEAMVVEGKLEPVKASGVNGKRPVLYKRYIQKRPRMDKATLIEKVDHLIEPPLSAQFYKSHLVQFEKDEAVIMALQTWLNEHPDEKELEPISQNERSFEIFGQEKLLARDGLRVLKNLKAPVERLRFYMTGIPLSVWSQKREKGNVLIVENMDPYVSIRSLLIDGSENILGFPVNTVGYGAGHGIERSFQDLIEFGDPALKESLAVVYYWGDLDYEGIQIFESLHQKYPAVSIEPWIPGYEAMLEQGRKASLPQSRERQRFCAGELFYSYFPDSFRKEVSELLEQGCYIPQEILNRTHYRRKRKITEEKEC